MDLCWSFCNDCNTLIWLVWQVHVSRLFDVANWFELWLSNIILKMKRTMKGIRRLCACTFDIYENSKRKFIRGRQGPLGQTRRMRLQKGIRSLPITLIFLYK
jgi:hypothetical protein